MPPLAQIPLSGANTIVGRAARVARPPARAAVSARSAARLLAHQVVVHELQDDLGKGDHSEPGTQARATRERTHSIHCVHCAHTGRERAPTRCSQRAARRRI